MPYNTIPVHILLVAFVTVTCIITEYLQYSKSRKLSFNRLFLIIFECFVNYSLDNYNSKFFSWINRVRVSQLVQCLTTSQSAVVTEKSRIANFEAVLVIVISVCFVARFIASVFDNRHCRRRRVSLPNNNHSSGRCDRNCSNSRSRQTLCTSFQNCTPLLFVNYIFDLIVVDESYWIHSGSEYSTSSHLTTISNILSKLLRVARFHPYLPFEWEAVVANWSKRPDLKISRPPRSAFW